MPLQLPTKTVNHSLNLRYCGILKSNLFVQCSTVVLKPNYNLRLLGADRNKVLMLNAFKVTEIIAVGTV